MDVKFSPFLHSGFEDSIDNLNAADTEINIELAVVIDQVSDIKGLSYSYFNVFGILGFFYIFFLYTHTFQKSKIQMGEAPLFLIY